MEQRLEQALDTVLKTYPEYVNEVIAILENRFGRISGNGLIVSSPMSGNHDDWFLEPNTRTTYELLVPGCTAFPELPEKGAFAAADYLRQQTGKPPRAKELSTNQFRFQAIDQTIQYMQQSNTCNN